MNNEQPKACHKTSIGGEALIEGIMMQGPKGAYMSVRLPDGSIDTEKLDFKRLKERFKPAGYPFIRGVVNFAETMIFGYRCMTKSVEKAGLGDDADPEKMSKTDRWVTEHFGPKLVGVLSFFSMLIGMGLAFFLFMYVPALLVDLMDKYLFNNVLNDYHPVFEGILRMAVFVLYIYLVSRIPDIKRVFSYHGAEHKTIFCYEHGLPLTVENVRAQSRFHPRCGTSFIFIILIISILLSSSLTLIFKGIDDNRLVWMGIKLLLLPVVVSIGYEYIPYVGKHENWFTKLITAPGMAMQRLTTAEPPDDVIEVGIEAMKSVITENPEDDAL